MPDAKNAKSIVFKVSRSKGYVYVMSMKSRRSIVKIGRTRLLSTRTIPTNYVTLAYFGSSNPVKDKARVAKKLAKYYNVGEEHYRLEPSLAVAEIRTTLRRDPLYVLPSLRTKYEATLKKRREELLRQMRGKRRTRGATRPENARARGLGVGTVRSRTGVRGHARSERMA